MTRSVDHSLCEPLETAPIGSRHSLLHSDGTTRFTCTWLGGWWRLPPRPPKWPDGQLWTPEARVRCLPAPARPHPERYDPALGWCPYCQRTHVAAYRPPAWWSRAALGRWRCDRCGAAGPGVDARLPLAEWAAFAAAMRVEPRRINGKRGRFETIAPFGAEPSENGP